MNGLHWFSALVHRSEIAIKIPYTQYMSSWASLDIFCLRTNYSVYVTKFDKTGIFCG